MRLWKRREHLPAIEKFDDYLFIVARNQAFSCLKRISRRELAEGSWSGEAFGDPNTPESQLVAREYALVLEEAIALLSPQQKQVYLLSVEENLRRGDIAKLLDISPETVKTYLARATRHIRAYSYSRLGMLISWLFLAAGLRP